MQYLYVVRYIKDSKLSQIAEWTKFDHAEMTMMEALDTLSTIVDESDPDVGPMFNNTY